MSGSLFDGSTPHEALAYQAESIQIVIVGVGGTGSWLAVFLARLVWDFNRTWELVHDEKPRRASLLLVDHDTVEEGNIRARQNFCPAEIGYPKAQLLVTRLSLAFGMGDKELSAHVGPFSSSLLTRNWNELTIIAGCVDNAQARQDIAKCLVTTNRTQQEEQPARTWWVDSGNALHSGQVLCGNVADPERLRGVLSSSLCLRLPSPSLLHPDLLVPRPEETDDATARRSCTALILAGEPEMQQSRTINSHMAALTYAYVEKLLYGGLTTFATYTDNETFTSRSLEITPRALSLALGPPPEYFTTVTKQAHTRPHRQT